MRNRNINWFGLIDSTISWEYIEQLYERHKLTAESGLSRSNVNTLNFLLKNES